MPTRRTLKGVAHNVAESFASTTNYGDGDYVMGHIVQEAWATGATELRADILTGSILPSCLLVPPVLRSIKYYIKDFPDLVQRSQSDLRFVALAELVITVDPSSRRPYPETVLFESPFTCTVRITDDRGKVFEHTVSGWWFPENPPRVSTA